MSDEYEDCLCPHFDFAYVEESSGVPLCECSHTDDEHSDDGPCQAVVYL
jgi:hypothetical protein